MRTPGMASTDPAESEPAANPNPVQIDGVDRVLRTGRQVPAARPNERRDRVTVDVDWRFRYGLQNSVWVRVSVSHRSSVTRRSGRRHRGLE
jgi:hypothetical protein